MKRAPTIDRQPSCIGWCLQCAKYFGTAEGVYATNANDHGVSAWAETPTCLAFLCGSEALASLAFVCGPETRATSAFLYEEEIPQAMALLKGSDCEILSCQVHFVTKIVEKVRIVISSTKLCTDRDF